MEAIARAFLVPEATKAQRVVRAQRKIRDAHIPNWVPARVDLPERFDAILATLYLIFNQDYASLIVDPCIGAVRLGRLVRDLTDEGRRPDSSRSCSFTILVEAALRKSVGPYALQAAIAALHGDALDVVTTDWPQIVLLNEHLRDDPALLCTPPAPTDPVRRFLVRKLREINP